MSGEGGGAESSFSTEQASEQKEHSQQQRRKVRQQAQPRRPWGGCPCATLRADRPGLFFRQQLVGTRSEGGEGKSRRVDDKEIWA